MLNISYRYKRVKKAISFFWRRINDKKADYLLKLYCVYYDKKPAQKFDIENVKSIALLRWDDKLGDGIMATAFIGLLAKHRPDIKITVLTGTVSSHWYRAIGGVEVIVCGKRCMETAKSFKQYKGQFDVVIDVGNRFANVELTAFYNLGAKHNMGYNKEKYKLFDLRIDKKHIHFYGRNIAAAAFFGAVEKNPAFPTPAFHDSLQDLQLFLDDKYQGKNKIAVNFFGSTKYQQFSFTEAKQFLTRWCDAFSEDVLMLIPVPGREDFITELYQEMNREIDRTSQIILFSVKPSFANTLAILKLSDFCFTPDTSVVHMASAIDVPVLAIYKNDIVSFSEWKPVNPKSQTLFSRKPLFQKDKAYVHEFDWNECKAAREKILAAI